MDHSVLPNARLLVNEGNSREWAETLKEMQNRSRYSSHNLLLSLPKDDDDTDNFSPLQSQPSIRKLQTGDPKMSKSARSVTNLPKPNSLPYTWKRSDEDYSLVKQATDRSYKHTYGDQLSDPFEIKLDKEFPAVKQKPLISNSQRSDTNMKQTAKSASFVLPSKVAAKIYTNLHKNSQRGKYVYVIKNMRKTTPAKKSVNLPSVIPLYNIQLVKSVSTVLTEEMYPSRTGENLSNIFHRPMAAERKYHSPSSGNLVKSLNKTAPCSGATDLKSDEIPTFLSPGREFRSADAYNKLLAIRLANKMINAESSSDSNPITSASLRHPTAKVTSSHDKFPTEIGVVPSDAKSKTIANEEPQSKRERVNSVPTKHITSVKVSRKEPKNFTKS